MTTPPESTILVIAGIGLPPYATRGATEELRPIDAARSMRRTVNGDLVDLSVSELRKYQLSISCTDQQPIAANGIWPGATVVVDCISELAYADDTDGVQDRTPVPGSQRTADGFVFYRPRLTCMVMDMRHDTDEWGATVGWSADFEEV
jgi:hypothetical protein